MPFLQQPFTASHPSSAASRKRKDRYEGVDDEDVANGDICMMKAGVVSQQCGSSKPRKLSFPGHRSTDSDEMANFLPLGAEDNVKMLVSLGLIASEPAGFASGTSPSSANSSPVSRVTNLETGYFPSGHYPNIAPYASSAPAFAQAQTIAGMDIDPSPSRHGPQCVTLPQLYVSRECGSALYARCPDCNFSWEVRNDDGRGHTLTCSP